MNTEILIENNITYYMYDTDDEYIKYNIICIMQKDLPIAMIDLENRKMIIHESKSFREDIMHCEYREITIAELNATLNQMFTYNRKYAKFYDFKLTYDEVEYLIYLYNKYITFNRKEYKHEL